MQFFSCPDFALTAVLQIKLSIHGRWDRGISTTAMPLTLCNSIWFQWINNFQNLTFLTISLAEISFCSILFFLLNWDFYNYELNYSLGNYLTSIIKQRIWLGIMPDLNLTPQKCHQLSNYRQERLNSSWWDSLSMCLSITLFLLWNLKKNKNNNEAVQEFWFRSKSGKTGLLRKDSDTKLSTGLMEGLT